MRRLILYIISVLPLGVFAAGTFSLSTVSGHVGDTVRVTASLSDFTDVAALQITLPLGDYLRYVSGSAALAPAQTAHQLMAGVNNGNLIVNIYNLSNAALIGSGGELYTFQLVLGNEPDTYALLPDVLLSNSTGAGLPVSVSAGSVTLLASKIEIEKQQINFGHVPIHDNYSQTILVRNIGNEPLHISNLEFSAAEFSAEASYTIEAASSQSITINYAPIHHGAVSETVRFRSDAVNDANVYGANLVVLNADPYSVNELYVMDAAGVADDTMTVTIRLSNMETNLVGMQTSFKMPEQLRFIEGSVQPLSRARSMTPAYGMSNDTLTLFLYSLSNTPIEGTDGDLLSFRVLLQGDGYYYLNPFNTLLANPSGENMISAEYGGSVSVQSPRIDGMSTFNLGAIPVSYPDTAAYQVYNSGSVPLVVSKVTFLQEGFQLLSPLPITINSYESTPLEIEFTPTHEGAVSTLMQIYSNDPENRMKSVAITASVFEPNAMMITGAMAETNYVLEVGMDNYSELTGVQFDLVGLMPFATCIKGSRAAAHTLSWSMVDENRYRFVLYAMSESTLGHNGTLMTLTWTDEQTASLDGCTVTMENITIAHASGEAKGVTAPAPWLIYTSDAPSAIDNINVNTKAIKIFRNGQIFILRGDKVYTIHGQTVK